MALSHILLTMTSQEPADRRAGKRGRCAPVETGFTKRQRLLSPVSPVCRLGAHPTPAFRCTLISRGKLAGHWEGVPNPLQSPGPLESARVWPRAGRLVTALHRQKDRQKLHLKQP